MESTKNAPQTALASIPRISGSSPLARGFTVNITEEPHDLGDWWLRVWHDGKPIENSRWAKATDAGMRVGAIILDGTLGANLRGQAMGAVASMMGDRFGGGE